MANLSSLFDPDLLRRYDTPGPRYTSYPTAPQFSPGFDESDLRAMADRPACEKAAYSSASARRDVLVARAQSEQLAASAVQREATAD